MTDNGSFNAFDTNAAFDFFEKEAARHSTRSQTLTEKSRSQARYAAAPYSRPNNRRISNPLILPPPHPSFETATNYRFLPFFNTEGEEENRDVTYSPNGNDDGDDDREERGRRIHREAEKQRRESLKIGFEKMKELLPPAVVGIDKSWSQSKLLEAGLEYIEQLQQVLLKCERENRKLKEAVRRIVVAHHTEYQADQ
ncbi:UNVERIFIED_CONTAM: hypothetical protein HDU68_011527 [Siphonaria sp. JEL0065]|nr:hypothetical protein HDU68_011527 [Siphonaria sp. JEL0065]